MTQNDFHNSILEGVPSELPSLLPPDESLDHAPIRKDLLSPAEKDLAVKNALRYFKKKFHSILKPEFHAELEKYGRIYMHRFRPEYSISARSIYEYPHKCVAAAAIMLMISNNLDKNVAQHPAELITYGGNGSAFQNWAQYRITMKYLATMTDQQTLVLNSGHPLGLFPSSPSSPRLVITNGLMVPNYSQPDDLEKFSALGVTQYGQMTAGSFMYIGPQGIVHGTTITLLNAVRRKKQLKLAANSPTQEDTTGQATTASDPIAIFVSSGMGGMSGAQAKASVIAGVIGVIAEINPLVMDKRQRQGWIDEVFSDTHELKNRIAKAYQKKESTSLGYLGNIVELWEYLADSELIISLGSDQTSLHNPWSGGYYPVGLSFSESQTMMRENPEKFHTEVKTSLCRHVTAINKLCQKGMYFFDYGNAFLLQAQRAGADVVKEDGSFKYPSYVEDIMGPFCFDYGFGPFRWVCTSSQPEDLQTTDNIAAEVLEKLLTTAPDEIKQQLADNLIWIQSAQNNNMVVGSQARILYADAQGRVEIALAFNKAIATGQIKAPLVLGRDHHDVSGTDSPYRETANISDGSKFTADMAVQNFVGDAFRGATWVSLHNGGGVGWGEVINGGFGMLLDGSKECEARIQAMLFWDVNNGVARRSWAGNSGAQFAIRRAMDENPQLQVTLPEAD